MHTVDEAVAFITDFYKVYHSIRYVSGLTVIRLNKKLSGKSVELLNRRFKDILAGGAIRLSPPTEEEKRNGEYPDLPRLVMDFNLRDYGRLCEMIGFINTLAVEK
jgi:hypothetical protein